MIEGNGNELQVHPAPSRFVCLDGDRVVQILVHLLSNAGRFTTRGTVELRGTIEADEVRLVVRDTGRGIDRRMMAAIFEPFFQVDASTRREVDGAGLGLTLANELAGRMGGRIEVESELGAGSTFALRLPFSPERCGSAGPLP